MRKLSYWQNVDFCPEGTYCVERCSRAHDGGSVYPRKVVQTVRSFVCSYGFFVIFTSDLCVWWQNTVSPLLRAIFRCLSARVLGPVLDKNFRSFRYSIGWFEVPVLDTFLCQLFFWKKVDTKKCPKLGPPKTHKLYPNLRKFLSKTGPNTRADRHRKMALSSGETVFCD